MSKLLSKIFDVGDRDLPVLTFGNWVLKAEWLSGLWNYVRFFSKSKKHDFLRFFEWLTTFSRTLQVRVYSLPLSSMRVSSSICGRSTRLSSSQLDCLTVDIDQLVGSSLASCCSAATLLPGCPTSSRVRCTRVTSPSTWLELVYWSAVWSTPSSTAVVWPVCWTATVDCGYEWLIEREASSHDVVDNVQRMGCHDYRPHLSTNSAPSATETGHWYIRLGYRWSA